MKKIALGLLAGGKRDASPNNLREWTQEMRQAAPDKFAELAEQSVNANMKKIDDRLMAIRKAAGQLAKRYKDSSEKYKFGRQLGKELLAAEKKGEFPVTFLGAEYDEFQLTSQIKLLAAELIVHANIMKAVRETLTLLEKEKRDLIIHRAKCKGQLDIFEAQVEIFKARQISKDDLSLLEHCAAIFLDADAYLSKLGPIGDVETSVSRAAAVDKNPDDAPGLEAVLAEFDEENVAAITELVHKVEDFGDLEAIPDVETKVDVKFESKGAKDLPTPLEEDEVPEKPAL